MNYSSSLIVCLYYSAGDKISPLRRQRIASFDPFIDAFNVGDMGVMDAVLANNCLEGVIFSSRTLNTPKAIGIRPILFLWSMLHEVYPDAILKVVQARLIADSPTKCEKKRSKAGQGAGKSPTSAIVKELQKEVPMLPQAGFASMDDAVDRDSTARALLGLMACAKDDRSSSTDSSYMDVVNQNDDNNEMVKKKTKRSLGCSDDELANRTEISGNFELPGNSTNSADARIANFFTGGVEFVFKITGTRIMEGLSTSKFGEIVQSEKLCDSFYLMEEAYAKDQRTRVAEMVSRYAAASPACHPHSCNFIAQSVLYFSDSPNSVCSDASDMARLKAQKISYWTFEIIATDEVTVL